MSRRDLGANGVRAFYGGRSGGREEASRLRVVGANGGVRLFCGGRSGGREEASRLRVVGANGGVRLFYGGRSGGREVVALRWRGLVANRGPYCPSAGGSDDA